MPGHLWELLSRTLPGRVALLLVGVALIGLLTAAFGHFALGAFPSFGEALWSATAHLVDPGSIGDDKTGSERIIGLVQVIAGIVFFAGIVLTVLTEVIDRALRRLQKGDPAIRREGHLLIVGFNGSLSEVRARLTSDIEVEHPEIVVMLPPSQSDRRDAARHALAGYPARAAVVVADPETDGYFRVCAEAARHIVILSPEGEADRSDLEVTARASLIAEHLASLESDAPPVAVEFRRGRNVEALWYEDDPASNRPVRRFPASFDALVNDRNIGALLSLAAANPVFADTFLDRDAGSIAPELSPAGACAGLSFGEARATLRDATLLGVLTGSGPTAQASFLPPDRLRIGPSDRLIVIPGAGLASEGAGPDPDSVKVTPTRPGPLLIVGWSDAARALLEDLDAGGFDLGRIHLLNPTQPTGFAEPAPGIDLALIEGDPAEPTDIGHAVERVEPDLIYIAVTDGNEPGAIISGMLTRQVTEVPVVVEQRFAGPGSEARRAAAGLTVLSTSGMVADTVAMSLVDPAILVAREQMLDDPGITLESLTYTGQAPLPLRDLPAIFGRAASVPLAVSLGGEDDARLHPGDHILALQRVEAPSGSALG